MKKLRISIIALFATFAMATSSFAFEGLSFGAVYSDATFDTSGREIKGQSAGDGMEKSALQSISKDQDFGSFFAEYTLPQGSTFGIEVIPGDAELGAKTRTQTQTNSQNASGTITAKAQVSDHTLIYAEPTKMLSETFGVYLKGGFAKVTVETLDSQTSTTISGTYGNKDVYGTAMGVGAKVYRGNLFAKLEYLKTDYGNMAFVSSTNKVIEADIDQEATRIALGYNF